MTSYRKALDGTPDFFKAHNNLGNVLLDLGQLDEAVGSYQKALSIDPGYMEAFSN